ncbi:uncharacterized protein EDB91DRAFT_557704 [Suillus paluster]|uniref:uncharacterized protein n=1 Tax=Suillus paluster TaxID=48578 RepID=UPI001B88168F|nr:uncharacterized protein EDB91DRAFT_557704 [Suillus paluster]KAG1735632.1 hypothetical protein EDB91DRAFT_557704 [Suillus paluster]
MISFNCLQVSGSRNRRSELSPVSLSCFVYSATLEGNSVFHMFHHQLGGLASIALMILGAPSHRIESRFIAAARIRAQHHDDLSHYLARTLYPGLPLRVHHSIVHVNLGSPPGPLLLNPVIFVHTSFPTSVIQLVSTLWTTTNALTTATGPVLDTLHDSEQPLWIHDFSVISSIQHLSADVEN